MKQMEKVQVKVENCSTYITARLTNDTRTLRDLIFYDILSKCKDKEIIKALKNLDHEEKVRKHFQRKSIQEINDYKDRMAGNEYFMRLCDNRIQDNVISYYEIENNLNQTIETLNKTVNDRLCLMEQIEKCIELKPKKQC
ncbi:hypothetical protein RCL_jg4327.t1 [Rhizophagus clarus]|uniref:Uncharacterized protein n=1 Tax=Rhizophagus clarus TaxID=94130 RepID=A0A8H3KQE0_9GLOM|nr:hypothetical protein RCL_jg4327.t1 [Rhizophagus clarus]